MGTPFSFPHLSRRDPKSGNVKGVPKDSMVSFQSFTSVPLLPPKELNMSLSAVSVAVQRGEQVALTNGYQLRKVLNLEMLSRDVPKSHPGFSLRSWDPEVFQC